MDESSADQEIRKSNATVHNLCKIWRPAPSRTGPYGRLAVRQAGSPARLNLGKILKACCRSKYIYSIFRFVYELFQQLLCISNAFFRQTLLQGCFMECEIL